MTDSPLRRFRPALLLVCCLMIFGIADLRAQEAPAPARHPLDPLTAAEIQTAARVLAEDARFPAGSLFSTIVLQEPAKAGVLAWQPGGPIQRRASAILLDRRGKRTLEAVVDLGTGRVLSWNEVKGVQPAVLSGEYEEVGQIVKADARWQAAMRKRGIEDFGQVQVDGWAVGEAPAKYKGARLLRGLSYFKGDSINFYGRPIEGVVALVDMNAERVVEVVDSGALPLPPPSQELDEAATGRREAPKPLVITQPDGASFTVDGQEVRWQKWRFRYTMHPREGLVLHTVGYEDDGRLRPILYRASLSEMVVPYGDTDPNW
ncbi:MAG TPA: tyramine oxidase, partial [Thermoanaerobaculia bacterium]|nr:tyramine oxidase [Thermoanaerobaculia bacterium]